MYAERHVPEGKERKNMKFMHKYCVKGGAAAGFKGSFLGKKIVNLSMKKFQKFFL